MPQRRSRIVRINRSLIRFSPPSFRPSIMDTPSSESDSYDRSRRREAHRRPGNRDRGRASGSGDEGRRADISDKLHILANTLQVFCLVGLDLNVFCAVGAHISKGLSSFPNDRSLNRRFVPQDTSRNLTKVDQTLGQYRNYADTQAEAMAQVYMWHLHHTHPSFFILISLGALHLCMLQLGGNLMDVINHFQTQMLGSSTGVQTSSPTSLHSSDLETGA